MASIVNRRNEEMDLKRRKTAAVDEARYGIRKHRETR
jgi:hypothetical protein